MAKFLFADLYGVLGTDEAEVAAELGDGSAQVAQERTVQVGLGVVARQAEELEALRAF